VTGDAECHAAELLVEALAVGDVAREGLLVPDGDVRHRLRQRPWVDPLRAVAQQPPDLAGQEACELAVGERRQVADQLDAGRGETLLRPRPDAGEQADVEGRQERRLAAGGHDGDSSGLLPVAGHLGHDLAARDTERAREARRSANSGLHGLRHHPRTTEVGGHLSHVEVALVEASALDGRHHFADRRPDRPGVLLVRPVARRDEHRVRTAAKRLCATHRRADTVRAGDVVRGSHDAPAAGVSPHDERL
jgi:hypothetical protein